MATTIELRRWGPRAVPYRSARSRLALADTWLVELFMALYGLVWGVGLVNPWTVAFGNASYAILALFPGGETGVGALAAAIGACEMTAALIGRRQTRALAFAAGGAFWLYVALAVAVASQWAAGGIPHFLLAALASWFLWARLRYRGVG